jgi:hypothetical protein
VATARDNEGQWTEGCVGVSSIEARWRTPLCLPLLKGSRKVRTSWTCWVHIIIIADISVAIAIADMPTCASHFFLRSMTHNSAAHYREYCELLHFDRILLVILWSLLRCLCVCPYPYPIVVLTSLGSCGLLRWSLVWLSLGVLNPFPTQWLVAKTNRGERCSVACKTKQTTKGRTK